MRKKSNAPQKHKEIMMRYGTMTQWVKFSKTTYAEIKRLQIGTEDVIPKLSFSRLVREIIGPDFRISSDCLKVKILCHMKTWPHFQILLIFSC